MNLLSEDQVSYLRKFSEDTYTEYTANELALSIQYHLTLLLSQFIRGEPDQAPRVWDDVLQGVNILIHLQAHVPKDIQAGNRECVLRTSDELAHGMPRGAFYVPAVIDQERRNAAMALDIVIQTHAEHQETLRAALKRYDLHPDDHPYSAQPSLISVMQNLTMKTAPGPII